METILIFTQHRDTIQSMESHFAGKCVVSRASDKSQALALLKGRRHDLMFIDINLLPDDSTEDSLKLAMQPFWQLCPPLEIIVMAPQDNIRKAVRAVKAGARDYLTYPVNTEEIKLISEGIQQSAILESELDYLRDQFWRQDSLELVQTRNSRMQKVFNQIRSVAPTRSTVLLQGDTGTGKTALARVIHQHSNRRDDQFISVHCGAIPDTLLESELFGHEKGAFTGAERRKLGRFEIAKGGTIFLDEIGTITPLAQIKLLQILQDGTFQRIGSEELLEANVRVIAASNSDLKEMSEKGEFRKDLYYRLNVFPIEIPPLKDRIEDMPQICDTILKRLNTFESKNITGIDPRVTEAFKKYPWPGNIRELENLIERAYILETSATLTTESFPNEMMEADPGAVTIIADSTLTLAAARQRGIEDIERSYLKEILARNRGKINESAKEAGISTRQLNKLMNRYRLKKEEFKIRI